MLHGKMKYYKKNGEVIYEAIFKKGKQVGTKIDNRDEKGEKRP